MNPSIRLVEGTVFAQDYKVIRPLRTGGQGSLYVVEQLSTSKHRALKLMLPELVAQPTSRRRFELEAKIAARIQSDHVVETIASGVDAKTSVPWLVMELLEGEDLAALLQKRRHLPPGEVLEIFGQLCHALGEAHKQGVVHRDLKPENIFLAASRRRGVPFMVKVLDFGIARVMAEAKTQSGATVTGLGTPMWMAPEQTMPGGRIEPMTDVWPLGLLAFRMLTGYLFWKAPYDPGASVMMLMAEAFMHPLPTATARAADYKCAERIPKGFDAWLSKCVARNMDERWADAAAAFAALEPILAAVADSAPAGAVRASLAEAAGEKPLETTGPGRKTWEGAPELANSAVISAVDSEPIPPAPPPVPPPRAPAASSPVTMGPQAAPNPGLLRSPRAPQPSQPRAEEPSAAPSATSSPRVSSADGKSGSKRTLMVVAAACLAGVIIGVVLFPWSKGKPSPANSVPSASATVRAVPSAVAPVPTATGSAAPSAEADADAGAAPTDSASADTSSSAPAPALTGRLKKLCKPAGQKCFDNDDCCDRVCRRWVCRPNEALQDPYGGDK